MAMMRIILCLLCALALLPVALAGDILLVSTVTWEQVSAWLGEGVEKTTDDMGDYGVVEAISKQNADCFGLDCAVTVIGYDGELAMIAAYFNSDVQTVRDRLTQTYGAPVERKGMALEDLIPGNDMKRVCDWKPDDNTEIIFYDYSAVKDYPYLCGFSVTNRRVYDEMEHAALAYFETED